MKSHDLHGGKVRVGGSINGVVMKWVMVKGEMLR